MKNKNKSNLIYLDELKYKYKQKMHLNYQQPHSVVRAQLKNESSSTTEETSDVENEPTTIKPEEVVGGILNEENYLFKVNRNGYGYRLSYEDKTNPLCFVNYKKGKPEKIIVERKDLTEEQLEDAYNVFANVHGYFKTKLKMECNHE